MDVGSVARYTKLYPRTIYNLVSTGKIPFRRINAKKVVFERSEIDEWMKTRRTRGAPPKSARSADRATGSAFRLGESAAGPAKSAENITDEVARASSRPSTLPARGGAAGASPQVVSPAPTRRSFLFQSGLISLALVVFAVLAGWIYLSRHRVPGSILANPHGIPVNLDAGLARINYLDFVPAGTAGTSAAGTVQIKLDYLSQPMEIQGQVQSPQIKSLLLSALRNENEEYSIKSKSIDIVQPYFMDPEIREVLLSILAGDKDPVIRMKAMTVLSKIAGNREIKSALVDRLKNDTNIGVRYKALELIENDVDAEILGLLRILKDKEANRIIRDRAASIYEGHLGTKRTL